MLCIDICLGASRRSVQAPTPFFSGSILFNKVTHVEGVYINLEAHPDLATPISERIFVYANHTVTRHFPIPESFWPESFTDPLRFPPRTAHPTLMVDTRESFFSIYEGFPCDRLSMEQTPFIKQLLAKRSGSCWAVLFFNTSSMLITHRKILALDSRLGSLNSPTQETSIYIFFPIISLDYSSCFLQPKVTQMEICHQDGPMNSFHI